MTLPGDHRPDESRPRCPVCGSRRKAEGLLAHAGSPECLRAAFERSGGPGRFFDLDAAPRLIEGRRKMVAALRLSWRNEVEAHGTPENAASVEEATNA